MERVEIEVIEMSMRKQNQIDLRQLTYLQGGGGQAFWPDR